MNVKLVLILVLMIFLAVGCVNYSEEAWLKANGSGNIKMEISMAESLVNMMKLDNTSDPFSKEEIEKSFKNAKGIKLTEVTTYSKEGNQVIRIAFEFSSLQSLKNLKSEAGTPEFLGEISLTKNNQGKLIFSRVIDQSGSDPNTTGGSDEFSALGKGIATTMFAGYVWKYKVHFPYKIISANTADEYIDRKNNTVTWDISFAALARKTQKMTVTLEPPFNLWEYLNNLFKRKK